MFVLATRNKSQTMLVPQLVAHAKGRAYINCQQTRSESTRGRLLIATFDLDIDNTLIDRRV